jgi:hypothetical protein
MHARAKRKRLRAAVSSGKTEHTLACLHGAVSGGAEKEQRSRTSEMIEMLVFLGGSSLSRLCMPLCLSPYQSRSACPAALPLRPCCFKLLYLRATVTAYSTAAFASEPPGAGEKQKDYFRFPWFPWPPAARERSRCLSMLHKTFAIHEKGVVAPCGDGVFFMVIYPLSKEKIQKLCVLCAWSQGAALLLLRLCE